MRYIAKRSRLIGLGLLLALSALTIYARFGARTVRQPKPVVAPTTNVIKGALPALRIAPAQSGGSFNITQSVVAGGGERSTGGTNEITGTIGQSLAAQSSGGTYAIQGGFWPGAVPSQCPIISIVPASVPNGDQGVVYPTQTFTASGGGAAYTFSRTGTLPPGLTFTNVGGNPGSAALTGTPTTPGTFNFTIIATDANQCTGAQNYTVTINCPTVTITTASLPAGTIGATYTATQLTASGGTAPHTFQIIAGTLPTGLTLTTGGLLSGTPTQAFNGNITVRASDVNQCPGERTFNLTVTCPAITVSPTNPALQPGAMSVPYTQTFTQTGGVGTIIWSNPGGGLPNGLTLNASTGELAGTPTAQGVFSFFIRATDANGCLGERQYSLTINAAPCPTITVSPTDPALTAGTAGSAYSQTFTQTGGAGAINWSVSAGTLPGGLTLNSSTGVLSGSPTTAGTSTFTIRATDINNCIGERQYSLTINPANNGLQFFPLPQPVRLLETRAGFGGCTTPGAIINAGGTFT
ncbi:MAG TPA: Ig domain-containing protein, partial [Blastocatellia bacterium]|nr:Ig domain-containing protein [Blastocatellia bacterium]